MPDFHSARNLPCSKASATTTLPACTYGASVGAPPQKIKSAEVHPGARDTDSSAPSRLRKAVWCASIFLASGSVVTAPVRTYSRQDVCAGSTVWVQHGAPAPPRAPVRVTCSTTASVPAAAWSTPDDAPPCSPRSTTVSDAVPPCRPRTVGTAARSPPAGGTPSASPCSTCTVGSASAAAAAASFRTQISNISCWLPAQSAP
mmetsp:Transcript_7588/g.15757  ORF Transcript_7588/g.15757 Transcript_7588/m.15757 type:complete len:202 (-) Transcript_7588:123-728(-)